MAVLTYLFNAEDVARTRLAISPLGHLLHGVGAHGAAPRATRARERWWHDARRLVPERARPLIELINALPDYTPCFLVPEIPADARRSAGSLFILGGYAMNAENPVGAETG